MLIFRKPKSQMCFKGQKFYVERAPEPTDIMWENIGGYVPYSRRIATGLSTLTLVGICGALVYGSTTWKRSLKGDERDTEALLDRLTLQVMVLIPSLAVILINELLSVSIVFFMKLQCYTTITEFNTSVCVMITIAQFVNTGLITLFVFGNRIYEADGVVNEMYLIIATNAIISPVTPMFNPLIYINWFRRKYAEWQGENCKMTQQTANNLFAGIEINFP
jgi:hypothetical protein